MTNNSIKLANLWIGLKVIKDKLDNEIIPVSDYRGTEDPDLTIALEELSVKIRNHFERFKLVAVMAKSNRS